MDGQTKKRYVYSFQTIIRFENAISHHFFKLRAVPTENFCQKLISSNFTVKPKSLVVIGYDSWGNQIQYGSQTESHDVFIVASSGKVELTSYKIEAKSVEKLFFTCSPLTGVSVEMVNFLRDNMPNFKAEDFASKPENIAKALYLSHLIYKYMNYSVGVTSTTTTANDAFQMGKGVCQDFSHILIALCRKLGIAARYVNGLMEGEGESHAWAEVYSDGYWWGVDPTNDRLIEFGYIKIAHGRDASDCHLNRGVFSGKTVQENCVRVAVVEL
ncbi:MAG: transglutaminase family protein [Rikenellaceae bacterium]